MPNRNCKGRLVEKNYAALVFTEDNSDNIDNTKSKGINGYI